MPIRFKVAAMSSSDHRLAMLRMTARASSGVRQPCSPDFGLRTRSCECWPPRQWIVRMISRACFVDVGDDVGDEGAQEPLTRTHGHARRIPRGIEILGEADEVGRGGVDQRMRTASNRA